MYNHGSQGIQSEGWLIEVTTENRRRSPESCKGKGGRKPKEKPQATCQCCGKVYEADWHAKGRYCSYDCMYEDRRNQRPHWFQCSLCLARVGLGLNTAPRMLGISKSALGRQWRKEGIRAQLPLGFESWRAYAATKRATGANGDIWWLSNQAAQAWMDGYNAKFPDWSIFWENKKASVYYSRRREIDHGFRVVTNLRVKLRFILNRDRIRKSQRTIKIIGCSYDQLVKHLEKGFKKGMTWENYGNNWHVDHIIPCAAFDHTDPKQVKQCWHWTNLRPLEAKKNISKGAKITEPQMSLLLCASH